MNLMTKEININREKNLKKLTSSGRHFSQDLQFITYMKDPKFQQDNN